MNNKSVNATQAELPVEEERMPWHKPTIARLNVALDTADSTGSSTDGITGSTP